MGEVLLYWSCLSRSDGEGSLTVGDGAELRLNNVWKWFVLLSLGS